MKIVLLPGMWLDAGAWDDVLAPLRAAGHEPVAPTLPGQDDGDEQATLDDQLTAVVAAIDADGAQPCLVVGHSAASTLAWLAADRRPEQVAGVALVGGSPGDEGEPFFEAIEPVDGFVRFPGWQAFEGPDSADLTDEHKARMAEHTHPVPASITSSTLHYTDERRHQVPMVLVCPEFTPEQAREWVSQAWTEDGHTPEVQAAPVSYVDIDSGHWPMFSAPEALASTLADIADDLAARA